MAYLRGFIAILVLTAILQSSGGTPKSEASAVDAFHEASTGLTNSKKSQTSALSTENFYANQLAVLQINLHLGTEFTSESKVTPATERHAKAIIYKTLARLPYSHRSQLKDLTIYCTKNGRRGYGGNGAIVLRGCNVTDAELASVLVHEMGHLIDGSFLFGIDMKHVSSFFDFGTPVPNDDPSAQFYRISWLTESKQKPGAAEADFASVYGMSDPFEDFAETYTYYRLHGAAFRKLSQTNDALRQKYVFMQQYVFDEQEFSDDANNAQVDAIKRNYDATVLPFSLASFFGSAGRTLLVRHSL